MCNSPKVKDIQFIIVKKSQQILTYFTVIHKIYKYEVIALPEWFSDLQINRSGAHSALDQKEISKIPSGPSVSCWACLPWWCWQAKTYCLHLASNNQNCNLQTQTPGQSRASNLTRTEAACVTFSAIASRGSSRDKRRRRHLHEDKRAKKTNKKKTNVSPRVSLPERKDLSIWIFLTHCNPSPELSRWIALVPPGTFSFAPRGGKSWMLLCLTGL